MVSISSLVIIVALSAVAQAKDAPTGVAKVTELIEALIKDTEAEGKKEADTYAKFAAFCPPKIESKGDDVQSDKDEIGTLSAAITADEAEKVESEETMVGLVNAIDQKGKSIVTLKKERGAEMKAYGVNAADLTNAVRGVTEGLKALKANQQMRGAKPASFMQLPQDLKESIEHSALVADAMGLTSPAVSTLLQASKPMQALLQASGDDDDTTDAPLTIKAYSFHAGDIVSALEGLKTDFKEEKTKLDEAEVSNKAAYEEALTTAEGFIKTKTTANNDEKITHRGTIAQIGVEEGDLRVTNVQLADDKQYLQELSQSCEDKKTTFDQRSKLREDESTALNTALDIVKKIATKGPAAAEEDAKFLEKGKKASLLSNKFSAMRAHNAMRSEDALEAAEQEAEQMEAGTAPAAFLQIVQEHRKAPENKHKQALMALLKAKGKALKSSILTSLATEIGADPLEKVKKLLQNLVEKLLTEASSETTQKGWCDKSLGDAKQKRDMTAKKLATVNAEMGSLETRLDTLKERIEALAAETTSLNKAQKEADENRAEEKTQSEESIKEANSGMAAVQEAITVLDEFYKEAANAAVEIKGEKSGARGSIKELKQKFNKSTQQSDEVDGGFDNGAAYNGAGASAGGIIGMLQVIEGDFKRAVTGTQEAEAKAVEDYNKMTISTQSSLAEKKVVTTAKTAAKGEATTNLGELKTKMKLEADLLTSAVKELLELQPACVNTGGTAEEKAAARQEEIEVLNSALEMFENGFD